MKPAFLLTLFVLLASLPAEAAEVFNWQQAAAEARKSHPDLVSARERTRQFEADRTIAASGFFPQIAVDAQGSRSGGSSNDSGTRSSSRIDSYSYGISGSQLLFDGFKTKYDVEEAVRNIESSRYNYDVVSSNVRLDLRIAFVELMRAQELLRITDEIAARRKKSRDLISLRYEAGREHRGSLLTAEANLAQAEFEIEQARRNLTVSQRRFLTRLGRSQWNFVEANGELDFSVIEHEKPSLEKLAETTPFLLELMVLKEARKWGVKSSIADFFPRIFANASAGRRDSRWPPRDDDWSVGASVSLPVFEGGSRLASVDRAKSVLRQAEADEKSGRNSVLLTLEQAWNSLQDTIEEVSVQKKFLEAAQEREKIAESQYSVGLLTFNDWIIIEDNLVRAEKNYLDARANALAAEADWKQAKGETLDED